MPVVIWFLTTEDRDAFTSECFDAIRKGKEFPTWSGVLLLDALDDLALNDTIAGIESQVKLEIQ